MSNDNKVCSWRNCEPDQYENGKCTVHNCDLVDNQCPQDCGPATDLYINASDDPENQLPICAEHARQVQSMCIEQIGCEVVNLTKEEWEVYKLVNC